MRRPRIQRFPIVLLSVAAALALLATSVVRNNPAAAAPSAQQAEAIRQGGKALADAERLSKQGKNKEAAELVAESVKLLAPLSSVSDGVVQQRLSALRPRLETIHTLLSLEGLRLPPLDFEAPAAPDKPGPDMPAPAGDGSISFARQVAPMLVSKCGRCHVDDSKGKFNMATFDALRKGSDAGVVIFPGNSQGSRLVEVIVDGDMPRGGAKVSKEELALLSKWIDEGAKYDGQNATDSIKQLAMSASATPPAAAPMMAALKIVPATGKETTSYSRDVASVVAGACLNCHGMRQPRANLNLLTFERFLRGGDSGAMIVPGKPEESLLVKKLKGTGGGQQMPQGRPPLPDEAIAKIEKWIAEGAKYDGENPREETPRLVALYTAKHATHEELSEQRQELAKRNWLLAMPGETNKPTILETDDFLLYGSVGTERLQEVADAAQEQSAKVRQRIKAPGGKPLVKGRMTLFVFRDRYDYNEFGKMVEQRDIPKSWRGHWSYSITDAYGCLMLPNDDEYGLPALLAQLMAGTHVASRGVEIPRWLSEGSARAVAADLHPRDSRIKAWNDMLPTVVRGMRRPDAIIAGGLPPEESDLASYGFVRSLKPTSSNYQKMLAALESGAPIDVAFRQSFRATPAASSAAWVRGGGR